MLPSLPQFQELIFQRQDLIRAAKRVREGHGCNPSSGR